LSQHDAKCLKSGWKHKQIRKRKVASDVFLWHKANELDLRAHIEGIDPSLQPACFWASPADKEHKAIDALIQQVPHALYGYLDVLDRRQSL
jgi:hypothetical protein